MDKSWMRTNRTKKPYIDGVATFLKYAVYRLKILRNMDPLKTHEKIKIPCPCVFCLNHYSLEVDEVDDHLFSKGIDQNYIKWTKHGEKYETPKSGHINDGVHIEEFVDFATDAPETTEIEVPTDAPEAIEMVQATEDNFIDDHKKFQELLEDAEKPLYEGCPNFTKLSAMVELFNLKSKYGVSDKFFNELLVLLKKKCFLKVMK